MTTSWRYQCPNGHSYSSIHKRERGGKRYYCKRCDEQFDELWDAKKDRFVCRFNNA